MFKYNPLTGLDFYKTGHKPQYPAGTEIVYSNFTARSNKHFQWKQAGQGYVILWGLQGFIKEFLFEGFQEGFFDVPKAKAIKYFKRRMLNAVGPITTAHIESLHDLQYLPVDIKALPEGTAVPIGMPMFTIKNTKIEFFWLTNLLETIISTEMWKPITAATIAFEYLKLCNKWSDITCDDDEHVQFQCHDFSMRGLGGWHDAARTGSSHLLAFSGTDTVPAIDYLEQYYGADSDKELVGASVPATEHSVMCMGSKDGEQATVERLLTEVYPTGIFSCVLDTWDFFKVLTEMLPALKDKIMNRDGKFVVRPDSGDPVKIITGYKLADGTFDHMAKTSSYSISDKEAHDRGLEKACSLAGTQGFEALRFCGNLYNAKTCRPISEAEVKGSIQILWEIFGGTINSKGYKVLDEHIGLIYGDSITLERADVILERLADKGFASSNVVFGVGSYTYQYLTRDTFGIAIKATWGQINGEPVEIFKDPKTDDGTKKSAKGLIQAYYDDEGRLTYRDQVSEEEEAQGLYQSVFTDSVVFNTQTLNEVRLVLKSNL